MAEITLPEVKLPDIKLPDGLRDMTKDDIVKTVKETSKDVRAAAKDVKVPDKITLPDIDLSNVELPDEIADRIPGRKRTNPFVPLLALTVIGLAFVAAWWLFTSATTGPRVRRAVDDLRSKMNGETNDLVRYDDERDLGSLVGQDTGLETGTDTYGMPGAPFSDQATGYGQSTMTDEEARQPLA
jgi:hypothetical protein